MGHPVLLLLCHFTHLYNNWFSLESKEAIFWERQKTCVCLRIKWFEIWVIFSKFFAFKKIFENNKLKKYLKKKVGFEPQNKFNILTRLFFHIFPQFLIKYFWKFSAFWNDILAGKFKKDDIQAQFFFFFTIFFRAFSCLFRKIKKIAIFGIFLVWKLMKTHFGAKI